MPSVSLEAESNDNTSSKAKNKESTPDIVEKVAEESARSSPTRTQTRNADEKVSNQPVSAKVPDQPKTPCVDLTRSIEKKEPTAKRSKPFRKDSAQKNKEPLALKLQENLNGKPQESLNGKPQENVNGKPHENVNGKPKENTNTESISNGLVAHDTSRDDDLRTLHSILMQIENFIAAHNQFISSVKSAFETVSLFAGKRFGSHVPNNKTDK